MPKQPTTSPALPPPRTWREERRRLNAFLAGARHRPNCVDAPQQTLDTHQRRHKNRKRSVTRERNISKVLRWQQRHPKTYARKMRAYRRRLRLRKMKTTPQPASLQGSRVIG